MTEANHEGKERKNKFVSSEDLVKHCKVLPERGDGQDDPRGSPQPHKFCDSVVTVSTDKFPQHCEDAKFLNIKKKLIFMR